MSDVIAHAHPNVNNCIEKQPLEFLIKNYQNGVRNN